ncbi:cholesterol 25-hydroxylase-like protein [Acipenser oxyrinchus oxyrinchus]|uniref:Cholesterol 25-hydroxylase-like protein n=1 Tax=Acipenser oxyrinchus oxyrinchus TaxID=40147 RepID=A0AAD8CPY5_ACIOX|nr:cholesterol 25-hydroxylase-like protein [Acipenser oxyrinchus oxyrinchus]
MNGSCELQNSLLLQPAWDPIRRRQDLLLSLFFPACFSFVANVSLCLPFAVLDCLGQWWPWLWRYKLRGLGPGGPTAWWGCLGRVAWNQVACILPTTLLLHYLLRPPSSLPPEAPSCLRFLSEVVLCLLLFDTMSFMFHVLIHRVPWLFMKVHSVHHEVQDPFALAAQYSSYWEVLSLQGFAISSAALLGCHPLSEITFHLLNIWLSVEDHCGYDLPWGTHRLLPFNLFGGAPFHTIHHQRFRVNYAPYFTHWDRIFGTYMSPPPLKK